MARRIDPPADANECGKILAHTGPRRQITIGRGKITQA